MGTFCKNKGILSLRNLVYLYFKLIFAYVTACIAFHNFVLSLLAFQMYFNRCHSTTVYYLTFPKYLLYVNLLLFSLFWYNFCRVDSFLKCHWYAKRKAHICFKKETLKLNLLKIRNENIN